MTTIQKNIEIALMLGAVKENWYPPNKDMGSSGDYFIFPEKTWYPNNCRQHGDYGLKFDSDYNWQLAAVEWVEKQGYPVEISQTSCVVYTNVQPYNELVSSAPDTKKEAIFECLYNFSQYLKML